MSSEEARTILYLNVTDRNYPRFAKLSDLLESAGYKTVIVDRPTAVSYWRRCLLLLRQSRKLAPHGGFIILAEFANSYAWVAYIVSKWSNSILIVDGFIGMYETHILDRASYSKIGVRAYAFWIVDAFALASSKLYLIDTQLRARAITSSLVGRYASAVVPVHVGAPAWAVPLDETPRDGDDASDENRTIRFLYYGEYTLLHSVEVFVKGFAKALSPDAIELLMIGSSPRRADVEALVKGEGIERSVKFEESMPVDKLASQIHSADVIVGVFGNSDKAKAVIPNKVWQGLIAGKVVLTQESEAYAELDCQAGRFLIQSRSTKASDMAATVERAISVCRTATAEERKTSSTALRRLVENSDSNFVESINRLAVLRDERNGR